MKQLVDVVNFNADASCLSSRAWLEILFGGECSTLVSWLNLYVARGRKVVLGFPGATVADMAAHNPESIALINRHPDLFQVILRPFAHDIALLRQGAGFRLNFEYGLRVLEKEFRHVRKWFLPPEFMLTNGQLAELQEYGVEGVFINPARFAAEVRGRIPKVPYQVKGLLGTSVDCIPFRGKLTDCYLHTLQMYDCSGWNEGILSAATETVFTWRDGESSFLLPDGLDREAFWLDHEDQAICRSHLEEIKVLLGTEICGGCFHSYPVHSFTAWMKEFRMLGFISRIQRIEESLEQLDADRHLQWLMVINSDIMSAVEKRSPVVTMKQGPDEVERFEYTIFRSERGFEGEEYLSILERAANGASCPRYVAESDDPHIAKWRGRINYLQTIQQERGSSYI